MKKFTLLVFLALFILTANAQLFKIGGFGVGYLYVGPKIGGNASYNSRDFGTGYSTIANYGYQFGGVAKLGVTKKLAIEPELIFSKRGASAEASGFSTNVNAKYFGIPVVAKYAFAAISNVQIFGSGGFYTDFMTGVETVFKQGSTVEFTEQLDSISSVYHRFDFGLNLGCGTIIPFKNKDQLTIDLRLGLGFVNTDKLGSASSRNTSVQLSAIYLVDLTKWIHFRGKSILDDSPEQGGAPAGGTKVDREQ